MLLTTYAALFFVVHIIRNESTVFINVFAIQTYYYPKSACHRIDNIRSKGQCLGTCIISVDRNVMISHDESTSTCMCCNDTTGSDIIGSNWKSYVPRRCKYLIPFDKKQVLFESDLKLHLFKVKQ